MKCYNRSLVGSSFLLEIFKSWFQKHLSISLSVAYENGMQWEIILDYLKSSVELAEITKIRQIQDTVGPQVIRIYTCTYVHIERDRDPFSMSFLKNGSLPTL